MSFLSRILVILGVPSSIFCLFYGFWLFTYGIMTYPIIMMIYGFGFWIYMTTKYPKNGIQRR